MLNRKSKEQLTASFDFDETLTLPEFDTRSRTWKRTLNPNWAIISEMCRLKYHRWRIYIVTERKKTPINLLEIREFLKAVDPPVDEVFYTAGYSKHLLLPGIQVTLHYDDDPTELARLEKGITGIQINSRLGSSDDKQLSDWT